MSHNDEDDLENLLKQAEKVDEMLSPQIKMGSIEIPTILGPLKFTDIELDPDKSEAELKLYNSMVQSTL